MPCSREPKSPSTAPELHVAPLARARPGGSVGGPRFTRPSAAPGDELLVLLSGRPLSRSLEPGTTSPRLRAGGGFTVARGDDHAWSSRAPKGPSTPMITSTPADSTLLAHAEVFP